MRYEEDSSVIARVIVGADDLRGDDKAINANEMLIIWDAW